MRDPSCDSQSGLRKGFWSTEEDRKLVNYIRKYGISNWCKMSLYAGLSRTGKSCRLRWMNYLNPNIIRGNFTNEEEKTILQYHSILGNRWSAIARKVPGRSDNEIKNHWHTNLKKRIITQDHPVPTIKPKETTKSIDLHDVESSVETPTSHVFSSLSDGDTTSLCKLDISSRYDHEQLEVENESDYHISSPGTILDIKSFWEQLYYADEDLELQNLFQDTSFDQIFIDNLYS